MKRRTARPNRVVAADPAPPPLANRAPASTADGGTSLLRPLLLAYAALIGVGLVVLMLPGAMTRGNELTADRLIFSVVDLATLTGFQSSVGLNQANSGSVIVPTTVLLLTLGGTLFSLIAGGMATARILRLPYTDEQVVNAALVATLVATLAGTASLLGAVPRAYDAVLISSAAFGNSGANAGRLPGVGAWQVHLVLMPLATLGGLGLTVLMELYDWLTTRRPLSAHARAVLWLTVGIYVGGFVVGLLTRPVFWDNLLVGFERMGWTARQSGWIRHDVLSSSLQAINARTAGLPFEYAGAMARTTQWTLLLLMAVGGFPGGTAGGVKGTTLLVLVRGVRDALAGRQVRRSFGIAATLLAGYTLLVALCFAVLLWRVPELPADQLLFLSVSAASNVGLSHDLLSIVQTGLYALTFAMLVGRLGPLFVLWWTARTTHDADVAVG